MASLNLAPLQLKLQAYVSWDCLNLAGLGSLLSESRTTLEVVILVTTSPRPESDGQGPVLLAMSINENVTN